MGKIERTKEEYREIVEHAFRTIVVERFEDGTIQIDPKSLVGALTMMLGDQEELRDGVRGNFEAFNAFILDQL